jgi:predicted regulator of amino acid metabolism with ACT domain
LLQISHRRTMTPCARKVWAKKGHIATRDLSISGSEVARRLQVDRSEVSRAVRRVENDSDLLETARVIRGAFGLPEPDKSQH